MVIRGNKKKEMKSVIVVGVERARPHILIEEWKNDDVVQPPIKAQTLNFTMGEDGIIQITGASFTIRFSDLFGRDPANQQERDTTWTKEELERYAKMVFVDQGFITIERYYS